MGFLTILTGSVNEKTANRPTIRKTENSEENLDQKALFCLKMKKYSSFKISKNGCFNWSFRKRNFNHGFGGF
jgi:hypothetical protein